MHPCDLLDDYLAHDLAGDARACFTSHLTDCLACRRTVREHEQLAALLTEATDRLEPVPSGLVGRVRRRLWAARLPRQAAAAAAVLVALAGSLGLLGRALHRPAVGPAPMIQVPPPAREVSRPAERARVTFPASAHVLTMSVEMDSPHVTFLWVYPGLREAPRLAPAADDPSLPERNDP